MNSYKLDWWKILTILLLYYTVIGGFLIPVPRLHILNESIRMNYFHVPMWFTMMFLFTYSVWSSIKFVRTGNIKYDDQAIESVKVAFFFGGLGLITGMLWANATWGTFWTSDPKLNNTAIGLLIYSAYFVLRSSLEDETQRGRLSAAYNIFAYVVFIPLIFILPRMTDSLHPGSGDNPTFRLFDTSHTMKLVIYIAIISFIMLGWWMFTLFLRIRLLKKYRMKDIRIIVSLMLIFLSFNSFCQSSEEVEMADILRQDGKIYTVVFGVVILLTALIILLVRVDRKLFKLESLVKKDRQADNNE